MALMSARARSRRACRSSRSAVFQELLVGARGHLLGQRSDAFIAFAKLPFKLRKLLLALALGLFDALQFAGQRRQVRLQPVATRGYCLEVLPQGGDLFLAGGQFAFLVLELSILALLQLLRRPAACLRAPPAPPAVDRDGWLARRRSRAESVLHRDSRAAGRRPRRPCPCDAMNGPRYRRAMQAGPADNRQWCQDRRPSRTVPALGYSWLRGSLPTAPSA